MSADSWFGAWCGLELNLISFIPIISVGGNKYRSEAALKYFLIQALGSAFVILGVLEFIIFLAPVFIMRIALLLKLGAFPIHFWFPQVIEGLGWFQCIVLITIQKIGPIILLSYLIEVGLQNWIVYWRAVFSAVVGALGGINQLMLRKLLAFSSINHISWIMFGIIMSENSWIIYFILYSVISLTVVIMFHSRQCFHLLQLSGFRGSFFGLVRSLSLLSLGGLPPFTGFVPKWVIIQEIVSCGIFFPLFFLLPIALVTLYYYLRISVMFLVFIYPRIKWNRAEFYFSGWFTGIVGLNFLGLVLSSVFILV